MQNYAKILALLGEVFGTPERSLVAALAGLLAMVIVSFKAISLISSAHINLSVRVGCCSNQMLEGGFGSVIFVPCDVDSIHGMPLYFLAQR